MSVQLTKGLLVTDDAAAHGVHEVNDIAHGQAAVRTDTRGHIRFYRDRNGRSLCGGGRFLIGDRDAGAADF